MVGKTLHPKIHGGILGRRGTDDAIMQEHGIDRIDMVVVNLYPFAQNRCQPKCHQKDAIENIDIGGPTMVRAAAKSWHSHVSIVDKPQRLCSNLGWANNKRSISDTTRFDLAVKHLSIPHIMMVWLPTF